MSWTQFALMIIVALVMVMDFMRAGVAYAETSKHWGRAIFRGILLVIYLAFVHSMIG